MPKLLIKNGEKEGFEYRLAGQPVTLGRDSANTIVLPDRRVSRRHAVIKPGGGSYVIEDAGSVNGTSVNNKLVTKHELAFGDEIVLGSTVIGFLSLQDKGKESQTQEVSQVKIIHEEETPKGLMVEAKIEPKNVPPLDESVLRGESESVQKAYQRLMILYRISYDLGSLTDLSALLERIVDLVLEISNADRGIIMLIDHEKNDLVTKAVRLKKKTAQDEEIIISKTIANQVISTGQSVLTTDALHDSRFQQAESVVIQGIRSTMCVPIKSKDEILGIMQVDTKGKVISFTKDDLELLTAISNQAAVAIENAKLFEDLKRANRELKQQQNQLIESEKLSALGKLAGGVAHDINNPMTSILGFSELVSNRLAKDGVKPEELKQCSEHMKIVMGEVHRCLGIVQTLLQFARRKKGEMTPADINEVVEASLKIAQFQMKRVTIKINKNFKPDLPRVKADINQLQQVFLNLIINARDAMEEKGGELNIETGLAEDGLVFVKIADTGCGIPKDQMEEVFKPLFTTKEEGKGTGLGLSICQDIVERHRGRIELESEVGKGSAFTVKLPVDKD